MPYTLIVSLLDFGPIFPPSPLPTYNGAIFQIPPGPASDTATSVPPATLVFPLTPATPVVPMAVLVTNAIGGGDLFRSGLVIFPPSPGTMTLVTAIGALPSTALPAMTAGLTGTSVPVQVPEGIRVAIGLLAWGFVPPHSITITAVTVVPGAGTLAVTITGTASYRWSFLFPVTSSFTYTTTLSLAPSGDARNPSQILRAMPSASTLSFTDPLLSPLSALVGALDAELGKRIEGILNQAVVNAVGAVLAGRGSVRTSTSAISVHRITITASGIGLQIGIADFRVPVVTAPASTALKITVAPAPVGGTLKTYAVHVFSVASGGPVPNATVKLTNYPSSSSPNTTSLTCPLTNAQGKTQFSAKLRGYHHDATGHGAGVVDKYPRLTATAPGFQSATLELVIESLL